MITIDQNRAIVRTSAAYDLLTCIGFVTPWTFGPSLELIIGTGRLFGLPGSVPAFDPMHVLFVNLMGSAVLVWSLARLTFPTQALGRFDAVSRALFAGWQLWAVIRGAPPVILAFTIMEIAFGIAEVIPVRIDAVSRIAAPSRHPIARQG
jgi:hypothetical protein